MADLWDFDESDLVFNDDRTLAANGWEDRRRASGGEYDTWYEWAVWDAETGERLASGNCRHTTGRWGESGKSLHQIEFVGPRTFVVRYSDGSEDREEIPAPKGKVEPAKDVVRLSFWGNRLGPKLVTSMASSSQLRRITELDLRGNAIGLAGAKALAAPGRLRRIETIAIASSDTDKNGLKALRARFGDRLEVTSDAAPCPEGARPFFTAEEYGRAIDSVSKVLKASGHEVATAHVGDAGSAIGAALHGGGKPPRLVVYMPGAKLVPRDPATSFEIEPALATQGDQVTVEGLYLRCRKSLAAAARPVLARLQKALLAKRGKK